MNHHEYQARNWLINSIITALFYLNSLQARNHVPACNWTAKIIFTMEIFKISLFKYWCTKPQRRRKSILFHMQCSLDHRSLFSRIFITFKINVNNVLTMLIPSRSWLGKSMNYMRCELYEKYAQCITAGKIATKKSFHNFYFLKSPK